MTKEINITIENNLLMEARDITVYNHFSRSAHMISNYSAVALPLKSAVENDYLHISIVCGPGHLTNKIVIDLPSWIDFEFSSNGDVTVTHSGSRILLQIPPGLPKWQLRMTQSVSSFSTIHADRVSIGDN